MASALESEIMLVSFYVFTHYCVCVCACVCIYNVTINVSSSPQPANNAEMQENNILTTTSNARISCLNNGGT